MKHRATGIRAHHMNEVTKQLLQYYDWTPSMEGGEQIEKKNIEFYRHALDWPGKRYYRIEKNEVKS